ncbi:MAG: hypothetical protein WBH94_07305 [Methanoculleus sp.]
MAALTPIYIPNYDLFCGPSPGQGRGMPAKRRCTPGKAGGAGTLCFMERYSAVVLPWSGEQSICYG